MSERAQAVSDGVDEFERAIELFTKLMCSQVGLP
jgi:hypothetical protein